MALDERSRSELLKARSRGVERLTRTVRTSTSVLHMKIRSPPNAGYRQNAVSLSLRTQFGHLRTRLHVRHGPRHDFGNSSWYTYPICSRPEAASDVISGTSVRLTVMVKLPKKYVIFAQIDLEKFDQKPSETVFSAAFGRLATKAIPPARPTRIR